MSNQQQHTAYIALGSNMGDREQYLIDAINKLNDHSSIQVVGVSSIYETDPVGFTDQGAFLNMAVHVHTSLTAEELLTTQLNIENELGRIRQVRWGPRTIDLDLLLYDNMTLETDRLLLPHPRMMERAFVLVPLHDVLAKDHEFFDQVSQIAKQALRTRKEGIKLWKTISWPNV